jgi:opacity protein-like surface antigen
MKKMTITNTSLKRLLTWRLLTSLVLLSAVFSSVVVADDDTYEVRPSLMWLSSDTNVSVFDNSGYDSFLGAGEYWSDNWGVSANLLQNVNDDIFGLPADSQYFNLDVKRRFGSRDKSNVELGLGWQEHNIDSQLQASGPKLSVAGRLNLASSVELYGLTSYFPELDDQLQNNDATAYEVEAGVLYRPLPSLSLKAGYRHFALDLEDPVIEDLGSSSGFLLGTDLSW